MVSGHLNVELRWDHVPLGGLDRPSDRDAER